MKMRDVMAILAMAVVAVPLVALAQRAGPGTGGSCPCHQGAASVPGMRGARMFDPKAITTVQGGVVQVATGEGRRGQGVHLTLAVGSENLEVMVGPSFYLDQQGTKLAQGDRIEVKGSRTTWAGQPVLVAQEIRKGDAVLALRDADGVPLWARGRGRW
jgi:hypothetical protein